MSELKKSDTPRADSEEASAMVYYENLREAGWPSFGDCHSFDFARVLERENQRLREQLEFALNPIHTCHDNCPRIACLMRRERDQLKACALEMACALKEAESEMRDWHFEHPVRKSMSKSLAAFDKLNAP